ncbi:MULTISPECIES: hypothetical protein [unclassified Maridesulfovibrio]|uniref:hypothetical protein n=1 Tax=unclassified Maridesulfovibrio TaxID=2794999 RepID=UPI003B3EB9D3
MSKEFNHELCRYNKDNGCDGSSCALCPMNPSKPVPGLGTSSLLDNPDGPACTESLEEAAQAAIKFLEGLYKNKADFIAATHSARLQNALERSNAFAS